MATLLFGWLKICPWISDSLALYYSLGKNSLGQNGDKNQGGFQGRIVCHIEIMWDDLTGTQQENGAEAKMVHKLSMQMPSISEWTTQNKAMCVFINVSIFMADDVFIQGIIHIQLNFLTSWNHKICLSRCKNCELYSFFFMICIFCKLLKALIWT